MTESELYDEAFQQMGTAPLEQDENTGPGRRSGDGTGNRNRWKAHTKKAHISIRIDADVYLWLRSKSDAQGRKVSEEINSLLAQAYAARTG